MKQIVAEKEQEAANSGNRPGAGHPGGFPYSGGGFPGVTESGNGFDGYTPGGGYDPVGGNGEFDGRSGSSAGAGSGGTGRLGLGGGASTTPGPINTHFFMSAKLDNVRINKDVNTFVQEIINHLSAVDGATVELKLEVEVNAPNGIPNGTVRTVSENCRTLKVDDFGFDG